jgi:membrane associated rhomboid family serine protease
MSRHFGGGGRPSYTFIGGGGIGGAVKALLIANVVVFVLQYIAGNAIIGIFGLTPADVTGRFFLWQLVTYMFLHSPTSFMHILFNMFFLWMFGNELEGTWGKREFYRYYFVCGIGAGLFSVLFSPGSTIPTIGASGAIYGILMAYGLLFPYRQIWIWGIIPIQARYLVMILGGIAFLSSFGTSGGGIAHVAHLGGMVVGYVYLRGGARTRRFHWRDRYDQWRRERLRRKFEVYYNRRQSERERDDPSRWKN